MREDQIKEADTLLRQREDLEDALKEGLVKQLVTKKDWHLGSANWVSKKTMSDATKECADICEIILKARAKMCIQIINDRLFSLGASPQHPEG
jgi:hypothetical protein